MIEGAITFKQFDQGAFSCVSLSAVQPAHEDKLCAVTIEFLGHRFYISLLYMGGSRIYGRTYLSKDIASVEKYLIWLTRFLSNENCERCQIDAAILSQMCERQILLVFSENQR